jgi:hypothetical protein
MIESLLVANRIELASRIIRDLPAFAPWREPTFLCLTRRRKGKGSAAAGAGGSTQRAG